jgi:hypothetical protein
MMLSIKFRSNISVLLLVPLLLTGVGVRTVVASQIYPGMTQAKLASHSDPWWIIAIEVLALLIIPTPALNDDEPGGVSFDKLLRTETGERIVRIHLGPGEVLDQNVTQQGNGSASTNQGTSSLSTLGVFQTSLEQSGFADRAGSLSLGSETITGQLNYVTSTALDQVALGFSLNSLILGVGDLIFDPLLATVQTASSSFNLDINFSIPSFNLNFSIFSGFASLDQSLTTGPTFSVTGDWANAFTVGEGPGFNGRLGTLATLRDFTFTNTVNTPFEIPPGTLAVVDFQLTSGGSAAAVPEPSTYLLFATGLLGLLGYGWRYRPRAT